MNQPENTTPTGSASTTHGTQPYPSPAESGVSPAPTAGADRRGSPASSPRPQLPEALPLLTHAQHLVGLVESGTATFRSETGYRLKDHPQWCTFYSAVKEVERNIATRSEAVAPVTATASPVTDEMVSRFLSWKLPATFAPDGGVSFDGQLHDPQSHWWPVGTNLFNAIETREMLAHVLAPATASPSVSESRPPSTPPPPMACSTEYRQGYEQAQKECAVRITELYNTLEYVDRQVRNVWPASGDMRESMHRAWAISEAARVMKATPSQAGKTVAVPHETLIAMAASMPSDAIDKILGEPKITAEEVLRIKEKECADMAVELDEWRKGIRIVTVPVKEPTPSQAPSGRNLHELARDVVKLVQGDARHGGNLTSVQNSPLWKQFANAALNRSGAAAVVSPPSTPFPAPSDKVEQIKHGVHSRGGVLVECFGVQIPHDGNYEKVERHAIVMEPNGETRASYVRKLRLLADNVEAGKANARGEERLMANEANAGEYPGELVDNLDFIAKPRLDAGWPVSEDDAQRIARKETEAPVASVEGLARYACESSISCGKAMTLFAQSNTGPWCLHTEVVKEIAELTASRDQWKARAESLDAQGHDVARERDKLRSELASVRNDLRLADGAYAIATTNIALLKGNLGEADGRIKSLRAEVARLNANPVDDSMRERATAWDAVWSALHEHLRPEYDAVCDYHTTGQAIAVAIIKRAASIIEAQQKTIAEMPTRYRMGVDVAASGSDMSVETTFRQDADGKFQFVGCRVLEPTKPAEWKPKVGDEVIHLYRGAFGKITAFCPACYWRVQWSGNVPDTLEPACNLMPKP